MLKQTKFKCLVWDKGTRKSEYEMVGMGAGMQIEMEDGRTVQVFFNSDGRVHVRGWGNKPITLGNLDRTSFVALIPYEEPLYDENGNPLK